MRAGLVAWIAGVTDIELTLLAAKPLSLPSFRVTPPLWLLTGAYLVFRARYLVGLAPVLERPGLSWSEVVLSTVALVGQYLPPAPLLG